MNTTLKNVKNRNFLNKQLKISTIILWLYIINGIVKKKHKTISGNIWAYKYSSIDQNIFVLVLSVTAIMFDKQIRSKIEKVDS